ncbi:MAG: FtsQ-type POTRA domain-containing protein [Microbacteriaceae bacterium]|nr:FtsQ-type POTRA domain-containing protein [Microbacteriaceae bacterium]HQC93911.1 FtsQ-type POTRA domain-containing protein [Microbacteriaceae bacterium]
MDAAEPPTRIRDVWRAARARRRVLRSEVRRFTVRARRRRIGWIVAGASTIALVATTLIIAYGPFFAVERIQIEGAVRLDAATLEEAVGAQLGRPLPLVDESEIKAALVQFPMVESYQIEARPPHDLLVRIVERTPIGVLEGPAGFSLVDAAGVVLETTPHPPAGAPLLRIAGGVDSPAFESAALVMRALPDGIRQQVTGVTASTRDDVTLLLGGANASVVWGSVSDSALKALVLETAMTRMPPAGVVSYDVSSPGAIVIR